MGALRPRSRGWGGVVQPMIVPSPTLRCHPVALAVLVLIAGLGLGACSGVAPAALPPTIRATAVPVPASPGPRVRTPVPEPCAIGRLTIGDLSAIDAAAGDAVAAVSEQ